MNKPLLLLIFIALFFAIILSSCMDSLVNPTYTSGAPEITLLLNEKTLLNAYITDFYPNTNFKNDCDFSALAFNDSSHTGYIGRTIFKIDLSLIPQNATVTSAQLLLNYNPTPLHYTGAGHHNDSGSNACYMQRITQRWKVDSVSWNNQPTVTTINQISLSASTWRFQNYVVDMTAEINDMVKNPSNDFGFLLKLQTESPIRGLGFTSGSCLNDNIRPVLRLSYVTPK